MGMKLILSNQDSTADGMKFMDFLLLEQDLI